MAFRSIRFAFSFALIAAVLLGSAQAEQQFPVRAKRILFIGDSITHSGGYVAWIETQLRLNGVDPLPEIINIGLSSETCSGLSEPDHPFPRPDIHERLDRALAKVKPDVVVSCYGMNDGIYYPFGEERFQAYQDGVNLILKKVHGIGAKLVLLTPTPFDPVPIRAKGKLKPAGESKYAYFAMYENYDNVLSRYGKWIMQQSDRADMVIDVHTPLSKAMAAGRTKDANYTFIPDGIHPNAEGQNLMGKAILEAWGVKSATNPSPDLLRLLNSKTRLLHDAWLSDIGHKRPGVKAGLPLIVAKEKADELDKQIEQFVKNATKR